ncbi:MAG: alpha/beta hydrolase family protein [Gemmataceae bacterium]|nr:alpha/beta hydrolase family protein [Gemmata sp.]MDW8196012.1 alpha/beta hydrolase family protein [Gemmataceae bacterium]
MFPQPSRRRFLTTMAAAAGVSAWPLDAAEKAPPGDLPRELKPTAADLGTLFTEVEKLVRGRRYSYSFLGDRFRTLEDFKKSARDKVFELLLYRPEKVDPKAEVLAQIEYDGYTLEKIVFSTSPHFRVPAYVLIPKKATFPAPAIIDLHSHGGMFLFGKEKVIDFGKNHPAMERYHQVNYDGRPTATALVRRGYVVISIDAFMFGERRVLMDADIPVGYDRSKYSLEEVHRLNQVCRAKEATIVKSLILAGLSWPGIVIWDDMRTVDYLLTRREVDPKRIGCVGISMGGYRAMFLAGLDERIAAACVVGFMSTVAPMIKAHVDTHSFVHFIPMLHQYLDWPDVVSMMAPKPLMVQQCSQDRLFPFDGMNDSLRRIEAVYEKAGVRKNFAGRFYDAPHMFSKTMQDDAFAWFDHHLKPK